MILKCMLSNFFLSKKSFLVLFFCFAFKSVSFSQTSHFNGFTLFGKISSVEEYYSDGKSDKADLVGKTIFDKRGFSIYEMGRSFSKECHLKKSFVYKDSVVTYSCDCDRMDAFVKSFVMNKSTTIAQARKSEGMGSGSGGGDGQPDRVEVSIYNKSGNVKTLKVYNEPGLFIEEHKYEYDKLGNRIKATNKFYSDPMTYVSTWKYDSRNNNIEREENNRYMKNNLKDEYTFDGLNRMTSYKQSSLYEVSANYIYYVDSVKTKSDYYAVNLLKSDTTKDYTLNYDEKGKLLEKIDYSRGQKINERIVFNYFESGRLKSKQFFNEENRLTREFGFSDDKYGNCIEIVLYQNTITRSMNNDKAEIRVVKYLRDIKYF